MPGRSEQVVPVMHVESWILAKPNSIFDLFPGNRILDPSRGDRSNRILELSLGDVPINAHGKCRDLDGLDRAALTVEEDKEIENPGHLVR